MQTRLLFSLEFPTAITSSCSSPHAKRNCSKADNCDRVFIET
jgi:hypothetical protein